MYSKPIDSLEKAEEFYYEIGWQFFYKDFDDSVPFVQLTGAQKNVLFEVVEWFVDSLEYA